jgi:hypothetical protein
VTHDWVLRNTDTDWKFFRCERCGYFINSAHDEPVPDDYRAYDIPEDCAEAVVKKVQIL